MNWTDLVLAFAAGMFIGIGIMQHRQERGDARWVALLEQNTADWKALLEKALNTKEAEK